MTDDRTRIEVDQFLPHPPAKVWRVLTEPDLIAQWLMPGDFRLEVGHRYLLESRPIPGTGFSGTVVAEVLAFDVQRSLRVRWRDGDPAATDDHGVDWTITWTLHPEGVGTRLFVLHDGFDPDNPLQQRARDIMGGGWRSHVPRALLRVLDRIREV